MLLQSSQLSNARIMSLHTGQAIAILSEPIVNPHNLEVVGFYCKTSTNENSALLSQDVREAAPGKILIDSVDEITPVSQLIRLQEVIDLKFKLVGKPVKTVSKKHLGKVEEYIIDTLNFQIQKIYVKQSMFKSLSTHSLAIDRQQIVEVSDKQILVDEATATEPAPAPAAIAE